MDQGFQARAARLVKQHAQTARLLGVDFMPRYQAFECVATDAVAPGPGDASPRIEDASPAPEMARQAARVEIKPQVVDTMASRAATGKPAAGKGAAKVVGTGFTPSTAPAPTTKPTDRAEVQGRLDALRARYEADAPHRQFVTSFNNIVFGDGDPCARLVFVGEAPGEEEDKTGKPFVGRAGQLLNKMIAAMGTTREEVYICNVLKTRPPNNATPTSFEASLCKPYLLEQLAILHPEAIVTLGLPATHTLLECTDSMARLRGKWASLTLANGLVIPVMPTYHPAFLLRSYNAENRGKVWSDLLMVVEKLGLTPSRKAQNEGE